MQNSTDTNLSLKNVKDSTIKKGFLVANILFGVFLIALYLLYGSEAVKIYTNTPELMWTTIIILVRVVVMFSFCYYMFNKWYKQDKRYIKNIPFLVGLFFYFSAIGKFLDVLLYIRYFVREDTTFLLLAKMRQVFFIVTFIPMLYLGLKPFLYSLGIKRKWEETKIMNLRRNIVIAYSITFGSLILVATNYFFIQILNKTIKKNQKSKLINECLSYNATSFSPNEKLYLLGF